MLYELCKLECYRHRRANGYVGQHRIGSTIEQLDRCDVGLKIPMRDELMESLLVAHQRLWRALIKITEQMADAVDSREGSQQYD